MNISSDDVPLDEDADIHAQRDHFLNELQEYSSKTGSTINSYRYGINKFIEWLETNQYTVDEIGVKESVKYLNWLKNESGLSDGTVESYAYVVNKLAEFYSDHNYYEGNPITAGLNSVDMSTGRNYDTPRRNISLEQVKEAITATDNPEERTTTVLLGKTGIRRSEASNLDLQDVNIEDERISHCLPNPRPEIRDEPDTLFIDSNIKEGQEFRGEERRIGNKRQLDTVFPLDKELKKTLVSHISSLPPDPLNCEAEPLLRILDNPNGKGYSGEDRPVVGRRAHPNHIAITVQKWAKKNGWYSEGEGPTTNVTPHWFRHFFTTKMIRRVDSSDFCDPNDDQVTTVRLYVKGLRGDVDDDVIQIYDHDWGENNWKKRAYLNGIYKLYK